MTSLGPPASRTKTERVVPLRAWLAGASARAAARDDARVLDRVAVAFGVAELARRVVPGTASVALAAGRLVVLIDTGDAGVGAGDGRRGGGVAGVATAGPPPTAVRLTEPAFLLAAGGDGGGGRGRHLEAEVVAGAAAAGFFDADSGLATLLGSASIAASRRDDDELARLRALGVALLELFPASGGAAGPAGGTTRGGDGRSMAPRRAGGRKRPRQDAGGAGPTPSWEDAPASLSLLIQNLLDGQGPGAYRDLESVSADLHLLLLDPARFLFDRQAPPHGGMELDFREETLYGRDEEVNRIQEAFCRVSGDGRSEAIFIGGHSGESCLLWGQIRYQQYAPHYLKATFIIQFWRV